MIDYKFSVLIPVYIKEKPEYLHDSLESVLNQTLMPNEIVIVEDGQLTKDLYDVIDYYKNEYKDVFTIVKLAQNSGMGIAMNKGLNVCKYDWVARMDSDDICVTTRFEKQISFLKQNPLVDVLGSNIEEFACVIGDLRQTRNVPEKHELIMRFAKFRNPMNHMTVFFKKDKALKAGGYWHHRVLEDYNLWYAMLENKCTFANLQEVLVYARVGNNMLGRRRGWTYLKFEINFFNIMRSNGFITSSEMYKAIFSRGIMKILPIGLLTKIYKFFLRNIRLSL